MNETKLPSGDLYIDRIAEDAAWDEWSKAWYVEKASRYDCFIRALRKYREVETRPVVAEQSECEACLPAFDMITHANDVIDRLRDMKNRVEGPDVTTAREGEELIDELLHRCGLRTEQAFREPKTITVAEWNEAYDRIFKRIIEHFKCDEATACYIMSGVLGG